MEQIKSGKSGLLSIRVSDQSDRNLKRFSELTGIPKSTLALIGINQIILTLEGIEKELQDNGFENKTSDIFHLVAEGKTFFKFAVQPLSQIYRTLPYEERVMVDMAIEKSHLKKIKGGTQ